MTVEDALLAFCAPEPLQGYRGGKGEETAATRSLHIARCPRVLILHLKVFAYSQHGAPACRAGLA